MAVLYGRRRVGKTFLLQHVLEQADVTTVYFAATQDLSEAELLRFIEALQPVLPADLAVPKTWSQALDALVDASVDTPIAVVLDEVPYLVGSNKAWPSILQRAWDRAVNLGRPCHLALFLTGSAIATMTKIVSSGGALFERPDEILRLEPFDLPTATTFTGFDDAVKAVECYAACGGYPLLHRRWNTDETATQNLVRLAGDPTGALATNASTLLLDLGDAAIYRRLLSAIGRGSTKFGEITSHVGQRVDSALEILLRGGYLRRSTPIGESRRTAPMWEIADTYLRFWFAVVERDYQLIEGGQGSAVLARNEPSWKTTVENTFENEARRHLIRASESGELASMIVGRWWTSRPRRAEVDVVGIAGNRWSLVGEVKWSSRFAFHDWQQFEANIAAAGDRAVGAQRAVWSRGPIQSQVLSAAPGLLTFTPSDVTGLK
jgi:uncharacterized protein